MLQVQLLSGHVAVSLLAWQDPGTINTQPNNASQYLNASNARQFVNSSECEAAAVWAGRLACGVWAGIA